MGVRDSSSGRHGQSLQEQQRAIEDANERLNTQNKALERSNRNYMEMLGFVSHELKGPLSSSVLSAHSLRQEIGGPLSDAQKNMIAIVCRNLDYASDMIKNYLDLSRIEKGELELNARQIRVAEEVIRPVIDDLQPMIAQNGMTVQLSVQEDLSLSADPELLRIVFQNLVSNAARYGRAKGAIRIWSRHAEQGWEFHVWNEGIGVPQDKRQVLFEKFGRVRDPRFSKQKGSGLGLFITRDILHRHGGDIRVECEEGSWIDFVVTLPEGCSGRYSDTPTA